MKTLDFRTLVLSLVIIALTSLGDAQTPNDYFGVSLDYGTNFKNASVLFPSFQYGRQLSRRDNDSSNDFRATLATAFVIYAVAAEVQLELLHKAPIPNANTFYYVGGGTDLLVSSLNRPVLGLHGTLGLEYAPPERPNNRLFVEIQPTATFEFFALRTRAGLNVYR